MCAKSRMKKFQEISVVAFVLVFLVGLAASMEIKECKGVKVGMNEEQVLHMSECIKEAGVEGQEMKDISSEKLPCIGKCVFVRNKLIDEKGLFHKENIMNVVKEYMPPVVHKDLVAKMEKCLAPENTDVTDPADKSCASYVPVFICIWISFMEVCAD